MRLRADQPLMATPLVKARVCGLLLMILAALLSGCGGSSSTPGIAHLSSGEPGSSASSQSGGSPPESPVALQQGLLTYAKCMRANGVPDFPDPSPGSGGFHRPAGMNPASPLFRAAQAKCQKLLPRGGLDPGTRTNPSPQTLARFLRISRCMREHGTPEFPDPRTSVPPDPFGSGIVEISDIEEVILLFPRTVDQQSPTFTRAAGICGFPLHNH